MDSPVEPVPEGTILFHAGFHKTGTTALQSALASTRPALAEAGVLYPGELRSHHRAAMAVMDRTWGWGDKGGRPPRAKYWTDLVADARAHPGTVMISGEAFALAKDGVVDRIVADLGADRLHAVFTLRPFAKLLASSYQQYLKYGLALPYEQWLEQAFANPPQCPPSPNFWRRNDHAGVMARWAEWIGPERVTLVVLDDTDRRALFRTFERLLALPDGLLVPDPEIGAGNRSMTAAEAETLRLINARGARGWDWPAYQDGVRRGAILRMVESRTPGRDEARLSTPQWAVERAQAVGAATAERVSALGIRVIGDAGSLSDPIPAAPPQVEGLMLPVEAAAEAVLGGILGATASRPTRAELDEVVAQAVRAAGEEGARAAIDSLSTREAAALLRQRFGQARRRRVARARGRLRSRQGS
jgi:hypothetical protein